MLLAAVAVAAGAGALLTLPADSALGPERVVSGGPAEGPASDGRYLLFQEGRGETICSPPEGGGLCSHTYDRTVLLDLATGGRREVRPAFPLRGVSASEGRALVSQSRILDLATGTSSEVPLPAGFSPEVLHGPFAYGWLDTHEVARLHLENGTVEPLGLRVPERAARHHAGATDDHVAVQWYDPDAGFLASHAILRLADRTLLHIPLGPGERLLQNGGIATLALAPDRAVAVVENDAGALSVRLHALPELELLTDVPLPDGARAYRLSLSETRWVLQVVLPEPRMTLIWGALDGGAVHQPSDGAERRDAVAAGALIAYELDGRLVVAAPDALPLTALALGATSVAAAVVGAVVLVAARHLPSQPSAPLQGPRCVECGAPRPPDASFCPRCGREGTP